MTSRPFLTIALFLAAFACAVAAAPALSGPEILGLLLIVLLAVGLRDNDALDDPV